MIRIFCQRFIAFKANSDYYSFTSFYFLEVAYGFVVNIFLGCKYNYRHTSNDECQSTVFQFACSISFCVNVRNFFQFQRTFKSYSVVKATTEEERIFTATVFTSEYFNLVNIFQHFVDLFRNGSQACNKFLSLFFCQSITQTTNINSKHQHCQKLGGVCFSGSYSDFRTCVSVNYLVCFTSDGRTNNVSYTQSSCAQAFSFAERCQSITGFTRLADNDAQAVTINQRATITEFTGNIHFNGNACQLFQIIFTNDTCVVCSTASYDEDFVNTLHFFRSPVQFRESNGIFFSVNTTSHSVAHSFRLFVNFFQHEMFETAFFSSFCIPVNFKYFFVNGSAINILNPNAVFSNGSNFAITHNESTTSVVNDCRNIGSDEVFTFAQANNQRVIFFGADDFVLFSFAHKYQRVRTFDYFQYFFNGAFHITIKQICHQVSNYFGISIRSKFYAFSDQFFFQYQIVFDDAVVNNNKFAAAISMGMAVTVSRTTMGCPTSMTNAHYTFRHIAF